MSANDDIIYSRDGKCSAWYQGKIGREYGNQKFWRLQTEDEETSKRLDQWENIWLTAYNVRGAHLRVYMVPIAHLKNTLKALDFPPRKRTAAQKNQSKVLAANFGGKFKDKLTPGGKKKGQIIAQENQNKARPAASNTPTGPYPSPSEMEREMAVQKDTIRA